MTVKAVISVAFLDNMTPDNYLQVSPSCGCL